MTLTVSNFTCKVCKIVFEGEYKPQQRPRKSCPKCHKMCEITKSNKKPEAEPEGSTTPPSLIHEEIISLTPDTVEKLIKDKLNNKSDIPDTLIRMALDYLIKLKITDAEGMEELDMELFLKHGA